IVAGVLVLILAAVGTWHLLRKPSANPVPNGSENRADADGNQETGEEDQQQPELPRLAIVPPQLDADRVILPLPEPYRSLAIGGGGRYLVLHLPENRKLAVFDVNVARFTQNISLPDNNIRFAAGLEKLVIVLDSSDLIERWDLATGRQEVSKP